MFKDFFLLSARGIMHRKLRSWLTVIGVFIGITAVVALISIGLGLERSITQQVENVFGYNSFLIVGKEAFQSRRGTTEEISVDLDVIEQVPGVTAVAAVRSESGFVKGPTVGGKSVQGFLPVTGLSPTLVTEFKSFLGDVNFEPGGRFFTPGERDVVILGSKAASQLHATLGTTVEIENHPFRVIGIFAPSHDSGGFSFGLGKSGNADTLFVPFAQMDELFGKSDKVLLTLVKTANGADVDEVADRVKNALRDAGDKDVSTVTYSDINRQISTVMGSVSGFLAGIAGISLLVGGVGVMNTMYTAVLERTREIGVMKAIGARRGQILMIFLIESGLMGLVGGIVGVIFGLGLSSVVAAVIRGYFNVEIHTVASPLLIISTLTFSFLLGAFAGWMPARRAAKLPVVDALRYE